MACTNKDRQIALQLYVRSRAVLGLFHVKNYEQFNKKANYYEANATGFFKLFQVLYPKSKHFSKPWKHYIKIQAPVRTLLEMF